MDELIGALLGTLTIQMGRVAIWLVSFGQWRGEPMLGNEGRIFGAAGALSFVRDGQRVITKTGLLFAGMAFIAVLVVAIIAIAATM